MPSSSKTKHQWIVSKQDDLLWIIGSAGVSLFLLACYFFLTQWLPGITGIKVSNAMVVAIIFLIWTLIFDSTHFFATYSRTFLDRQFYTDNKLMLYSSLSIFALGPLFLVTPLSLNNQTVQAAYSYAIFALIIFGSILWGYYHLVRQHWGFIALYQKKNKESNPFQLKLDALLLSIGSLWPFVFYMNKELAHQPLLIELLLTLQDKYFIEFLFHLSGMTLIIGSLCFRFNALRALAKLFLLISGLLFLIALWNSFNNTLSLDNTLARFEIILRYLFLCCLILYSGYYLFFRNNWNIPKFLLMASVLLTYNLILVSVTDFLLISACLTIFHNIQYHRIVRYFNVNHYRNDEDNHANKHGFAVALTKSLKRFIFIALIFSALVFILRGSTTLAESGLIKMILITSIINGISLHHYFLDGLIWRTSKNNQLITTLNLN